MDEELRIFLTEQFGALRREIDQRFDGVDQRFAGIDQQFAELRRELDGRFAEIRRHFDVIGEGLRADIRLVAEGHALLREELRTEVQELRRESEAEHRETRAAIKFSYTELDRRLTRLEALTVDLEGRLSRLEQER